MPDQILTAVPLTNPTVATVDGMVGEVADLVGGSEDPEVRSKAIKLLDRAADRLNLSGVFLYRRKVVEYDQNGTGDLDLTEGDTTITLPSDWGWPEKGVFALDSNGDKHKEIMWLSWETFTELTGNTSGASGIPEAISIRNEIENLAHVWPPIKTADGDVDRLQVPYFARILRPSEVSDANLLASKETIEALITGGEALMMRFRHKNQPQIWIPFMNDFKVAAHQAKAAAHRNQQVIDSWATLGETGYEGLTKFGDPKTVLVIRV